MVRRFWVTSSPRWPSPRVAPCTNVPFSYIRATAKPSSFSSHTQIEGLCLQQVGHPLAPRPELIVVEGVGQAKHRLLVLHLCEACGRLGPHPLRGRVGRNQLRVILLEALQLAEQSVVLLVAYLGGIKDVVAVVVVVELFAEQPPCA